MFTRLLSCICAVCLTGLACWFTEDNFNSNYIYAVNGAIHYVPGQSMSQAVYSNGGAIALAGTPYVKVGTRTPEVSGDSGRNLAIKCLIFRYRVFSSSNVAKGPWMTVGFYMSSAMSGWTAQDAQALRQALPEPYATQLAPVTLDWTMDFSEPVRLFGANSLNPRPMAGLYPGNALASGDIILMEYYLNDGLFETGDLTEDITPDKVQATEDASWQPTLRQSFLPPFIFKVTYNGKKRIGK